METLDFEEGDTVNVRIDDPRETVADGWKLGAVESIRHPEWDEEDVLVTGSLDRGGSFMLTEKRDGLSESVEPIRNG